ncbi:MAG: hypothetical protein JWO69_1258 [Thermoleophilia bacterium]|nr:hypothetical protein [Thermoleophilia bacterium]
MAVDVAATQTSASQSAVALTMLSASTNATAQMMATLMQSLEAVQPEGVGGSVNTYG